MSTLAKNYPDFRRILKEQSGIDLGDQKQTLLESRISRRLIQLNAKNYEQYLKIIQTDESELKLFVETMTTNKTDWFREEDHFQFLTQHIAKNKSQYASDPCLIWSAASSTGEEAYTIAMTCEETAGLARNYRIFGTDINLQVLARAEAGIYGEDYLKSQVPPNKIKSYFRPSGEVKKLQVSPELRAHTKFRHYNLLESQLPPDLKFDYIFLRNVLIYFDNPTIEKVIARLLRHLKKGGHLLIGHSETLNGIRHPLKHIGQSIYIYE